MSSSFSFHPLRFKTRRRKDNYQNNFLLEFVLLNAATFQHLHFFSSGQYCFCLSNSEFSLCQRTMKQSTGCWLIPCQHQCLPELGAVRSDTDRVGDKTCSCQIDLRKHGALFLQTALTIVLAYVCICVCVRLHIPFSLYKLLFIKDLSVPYLIKMYIRGLIIAHTKPSHRKGFVKMPKQ